MLQAAPRLHEKFAPGARPRSSRLAHWYAAEQKKASTAVSNSSLLRKPVAERSFSPRPVTTVYLLSPSPSVRISAPSRALRSLLRTPLIQARQSMACSVHACAAVRVKWPIRNAHGLINGASGWVINKAVGNKGTLPHRSDIGLVFLASACSADSQLGAPRASRDESDLKLFRGDLLTLRAHADQVRKLSLRGRRG